MLGGPWTATVRAIEVLTAALAIGVIIVAVQGARVEAGRPAVEARLPMPPGDLLVGAQPLRPAQATPKTSSDRAKRQTGSTVRYAAPKEALPATRARSVSGPTRSSVLHRSSSAPSRRLAAVLDLGPSAPASTVGVALLAKQRLETQGYDVTLVTEDAPVNAGPLRPDAYVSIRSVASVGSATGVEAWFCHIDGSLSSQLADLLLRNLATAGLPSVGQGDGDVEDPEAFRCDLLLAGRARMPTVLLEIPALAAENAEGQALAEGLAAGVQQFFRKYRNPLLREDRREGLVWPALGRVTSHFGPNHPLGIDIGQPEGPVVAATDGVVVFAGGNPCCSYGLFVVVESTNGIITLYAHLDSISVTSGQRVRQGQPLGNVGCTGHCFGNHLHFEVIENGMRRDPLSYLP